MSEVDLITEAQTDDAAAVEPPVAKKIPHTVVAAGDTRVDNYFWLREKSNPKVIAHLNAENAYTDALMRPTEALQAQLYQEMLGRIKETDASVPYRLGAYRYYTRTEAGKQYPIYCRRRAQEDAAEEITLNLNELAEGEAFLAVGAYRVGDDGNLLAYTVDTTGYRQYTLRVKDLGTGALLPDAIERVDAVEWAQDNRTLFCVTEDAITKRADKLFRHTLGDDAVGQLVYEEPDELYNLTINRSRDKKYIFVTSESTTTTEVRFIPTAQPAAAPQLINPRQTDHRYYADHRRNFFYILTDSDAKNFRVVTAPAHDPQQAHWRELLPHRPAVKLDNIELFANHCVIEERENGLQYLSVIELRDDGSLDNTAPGSSNNNSSNQSHRIAFDEPVYSLDKEANPEFETNVFRFRYQSLVTPASVYDYDMQTRVRQLLKQTEVPGGYDPARYICERLFAKASDNTQIPISIVYRKDAKRDGRNPLLLYAYGSYGISIPATFNAARLSLLERGFIYAIAHIRGGGELGEEWHDAGKLMHKRNTFTDFVASAEHLINENYTSAERLVAQGGSAGGLLMGAVANMRPELFRIILAQVPFVDVLTTMLDASLPLTVGEYLEWGDPNEPQAYAYMKSYSPYDNIEAKAYPTMLVKTGLNDSQVMYWEPAKYVAKLREMKTNANALLFKINMSAGHGGASGRYDALKETAFDYAFILKQLGMAE